MKLSMPGSLTVLFGFGGPWAIGAGAFGWMLSAFATLLRVLVGALKFRESGCHVLLRHASSCAFDDTESRLLPHAVVGDVMTVLPGEKAGFDALMPWGTMTVWPTTAPGGPWKGCAPEGTLRRRPGAIRLSVNMLWDRECEVVGDAIADQRGLLWLVEKVADVGVLKSPGEGCR